MKRIYAMDVKNRIELKLQEAFSPSFLKVEDESHLHITHGNYRPGGGSHISVTIISPIFSGMSRIERHKRVYECLDEELKKNVHALRLNIMSPEEREASIELG
jgi:BolA protein